MNADRTLDPRLIELGELYRDTVERLGPDHLHSRFLLMGLIAAMPKWLREELRKEGVARGELPPSTHCDADGFPTYGFDELSAHFGQTVEEGKASLDALNQERAMFGLPRVDWYAAPAGPKKEVR